MATLTNQPKAANSTLSNYSLHSAIITNYAKKRALGDYTMAELAGYTLAQLAGYTFLSIFTPMANQTKH